MRVEKCGRDEQHAAQLRQHADWLLQLGNGILPTHCTLLPYSVQRSVVNELQVVALFDVQR